MAFKDGDFLKIEYDAYRVADNSLVYTTDEKKAKENDIFDKEVKYGPQLAIVGKKNIIEGLDTAIKDMGLNESKKVELGPDEAFGDRNPNLVQVMSINDFRKRDIVPYPGLKIDLDGTMAVVKSVNSGRVLVDANHPLAGEKLIYQLKIVAKIDSEKEKLEALADYYGVKPDKVELSEFAATVEYRNNVNKDANYSVNKARFVSGAFTYIDNIKKVYIKEEYDRPSSKTQNATE